MKRTTQGSTRYVAAAALRRRDRQLTAAVIRVASDLVGTVTGMERTLTVAQRCGGLALRDAREATGMSLREMAKGIRLSPAALSQLERGRTWEGRTAERAIRFLASTQ